MGCHIFSERYEYDQDSWLALEVSCLGMANAKVAIGAERTLKK